MVWLLLLPVIGIVLFAGIIAGFLGALWSNKNNNSIHKLEERYKGLKLQLSQLQNAHNVDTLSRLEKEVSQLKDQLSQLGVNSAPLSQTTDSSSPNLQEVNTAEQRKSDPPVETIIPVEAITTESTQLKAEVSAKPAAASTRHAKPAKESATSKQAGFLQTHFKVFIGRVLQFFIERWMVILGIVFLVIGVGFLGTIAFLRFSPFLRFLTISAIAASFATIHLTLRRRRLWRDLSLLFLSASSAVFLYACVGSWYITPLKWIDSVAGGTALIVLGIAVNFALAILQKQPYIRAFHTILALLSLTFAPASLYLPIIASLTALFAIMITAGLMYEWDIIIITLSFSLYNMIWREKNISSTLLFASETYNFLPSLLTSSLVYFAALYKSYFRLFRNAPQHKLLLGSHLVYWVLLCVNLVIYLPFYEKFQTVPIAFVCAGLVILLLAFRARGQNWLFIIDAFVGKIFLITGLLLFTLPSFGETLSPFSAYFLIAISAIALSFLFAFFKKPILYFSDGKILALASLAMFFSSISLDASEAIPQIYMFGGFGVLGFALSFIVRRWKIQQLFFTLALINQAIVLAAIYLLYYYRIIDNLFYNLTLIFFTSLIFATLLRFLHERKLYKVILIAAILIGYGLLPVGIWLFDVHSIFYRMLFVLLPFPIAIHYILQQYSQPFADIGRLEFFQDSGTVWYKNRISLLCILAGLFPLGLYGILLYYSFFSDAMNFQIDAVFYSCIVALGLGALLLKCFGKKASIRMDFQNISYLYNLAFFVSFALLILSYKTVEIFSHTMALYLLSLIFLYFAVGLMLSRAHDGKRSYQPQIYGLTAVLLCVSYLFLPLTAAAVWLFLSLVALELSRFFETRCKGQSKSDDLPFHLLECGLILLISGLLRLYLVVLQVEEYAGLFKLRWFYEVFAAASLLYWIICKNMFQNRRKNFAWQVKFLPELLILFVASIFIYELQGLAFLQPLVWILFAYLLSFAGLKKQNLSRLKLEGLLFFLISLGQTVFTTSTYYTPRVAWQYNPIVWGIVLFFIAGGFVYLSYKKNITITYKKKIWSPRSRNFLCLYPLAVALGVFLYWNFSNQTLTLLWIVEFFFIFILSLLLRENSFLHVASAGILLCIGRLIFYDLQGESIPIRALLFLSVGTILVGMHIIYKKFRRA